MGSERTGQDGHAPELTRRTLLTGGAALGVAGVTYALSGIDDRPRHIDLYSDTVAFTAPGERELISEASALVPGLRVVAGVPDEDLLASEQVEWLAGLAPWTRDSNLASHEPLRSALLDLYVLSHGLPGAVAAWTPYWRYIWPRDTAHIAVALALVGDTAGAVTSLRFLAQVPRPEGWYEARYLLDASGPPDSRARQLDGSGWALWALGSVAAIVDDASRAEIAAEFAPLVAELEHTLADLIGEPEGSLPPSPDYWERGEERLTLGTAAPVLAGLRAATRVWGQEVPGLQGDASRLEGQIVRDFSGSGYQRYGMGRGFDVAPAFLLPPYNQSFVDAVTAARALNTARTLMRRPAGGYSPGARWHPDGISWTPQTSIFAMTAAYQGRTAADGDIDWLARHRTEAGSIPEKVLADGAPAAVAPLAWSAANVILAIAAAEHGVLVDPT